MIFLFTNLNLKFILNKTLINQFLKNKIRYKYNYNYKYNLTPYSNNALHLNFRVYYTICNT